MVDAVTSTFDSQVVIEVVGCGLGPMLHSFSAVCYSDIVSSVYIMHQHAGLTSKFRGEERKAYLPTKFYW